MVEMLQGSRRKFLFVTVVLTVVGSIYAWFYYKNQTSAPLVWETCIKFPGSVIQESYPVRCVTRDGRSVLQPVDGDNSTFSQSALIAPSPEYYGNSTFATCSSDSECVISGCNSEICQGERDEGSLSICILPDKPTPQQLGFTCRCYTARCQWYK